MNSLVNWFLSNYIEIFGAVSGLIYLLFSVKQNIWLWPLGIITSSIYIYVFYKSGFYADMGLQYYYLVISFYGWYNWIYGKKKISKTDKLPVTATSNTLKLYLLIITCLIFVVISYVLVNFTDSEIPYWDAFTTSASITATWMLARKYIGHWIIWIIVDAVSAGLYLYKSLYPTVVLFVVYTTMAVWGYKVWKREMQNTAI